MGLQIKLHLNIVWYKVHDVRVPGTWLHTPTKICRVPPSPEFTWVKPGDYFLWYQNLWWGLWRENTKSCLKNMRFLPREHLQAECILQVVGEKDWQWQLSEAEAYCLHLHALASNFVNNFLAKDNTTWNTCNLNKFKIIFGSLLAN